MLERIKNEPVMVMGVIQSAIALAVAFGLDLTAQQVGEILAFTAAILSVITRQTVTPNRKQPPPPSGGSSTGDDIPVSIRSTPPANDPPGAAMVAIPGLTVALMLAGCGSTLADEKPPCDAATLGAITAQCTAQLRAECGPYPDESCEQWEAITTACDARISEWEVCE